MKRPMNRYNRTLLDLALVHRTVPVIVITGAPGQESAQEVRAAGAFDVLAKPFDMAALQSLVAQATRVAPRM
jgi:DNA-binding NtrC family response regulator